MKNLYIGNCSPGTASQLRKDTLREVCAEAEWDVIDTEVPFLAQPRWKQLLALHLRMGPAVAAINTAVQEDLADATSYDLVWIDKATLLNTKTIDRIRELAAKLVHYTSEPAFFGNRSKYFEQTIDRYDLLVTSKSYELEDYGRYATEEKIKLVSQAYDARLHYPRCSFTDKRNEAVFVGECEPDFAECIEELIGREINVRVGGPGWDRFAERHAENKFLHYEGDSVEPEQYADLLSHAQIGLGLTTTNFPEQHAERTFEIPACGTALATPTTPETVRFFSADSAIYFRNYSDLSDQITELLNDPGRLMRLTHAGQDKVRDGIFSNTAVIADVLQTVGVARRA